MERKIYLLTKNKDKLKAAKNVFGKYNIQLASIDESYPEIQDTTSAQIAKFASEAAAQKHKVPVLREDHSLYIDALEYFPGPFTAYFDKNMPVHILLKMLEGFDNRNARMQLAAALTIPEHGTFEASYDVPLTISTEAKGDSGNWNKVLMLKDDDKTFSESHDQDRMHIWKKNYDTLAKKFVEIYTLSKNKQ